MNQKKIDPSRSKPNGQQHIVNKKFHICFDITIKFYSLKLNFGAEQLFMGIRNPCNAVHSTRYN